MKYNQVDKILNALEKHINAPLMETYLVTNVNPMLTGTKLIHVLLLLAERYPVSEFRAGGLSETITKQC
jgi:hypothetical protein